MSGTRSSDKREQAYRGAMRELGFDAAIEVAYTEWNFATAQQAARELLERDIDERPTAVCCVCDHAAMMLISTAAQLGLRIPQDLAVTGFDDLAVASFYNPPLTTIEQPFEAMGRAAVRCLLNLGDDPDIGAGVQESLPTRLIVRGSTVAPAALASV